jgi:serine phosphatase RsbU (regulator of sigma subunit)
MPITSPALHEFIQKLVNLGIHPEDGFHEKRKIQISNYLLIYLFFLNILNAFVYGIYYYQEILLWDAISSFVFCMIGFSLHAIGYRVFTRHLIMVAVLVSLGNITYQFGNVLGVHFFLLFLTIISFLLFDDMILILFYTLAICVLYILHDAWFQYHPQIVDEGLRFSYYPNFFVAFLMFIFVIYNFRHESDRYQEIVEAQNKDLSALSFKMMIQKDEALIATNQLKQKSAILQQQNKSIFDSLRLASMLQHETLPSEEELFGGLKSGMLLYKPKDVVSGDFYWAKRTYQGLILVIADCIGHGVPGGMMAVFASNLISQIVEEQGKSFPSDILEELDRRLRRRLKQDPNSELGDGMDIAVCLITDTTLSFASASRPIIRISAEGKSQIIPGTRFQLATWATEDAQYETIEMEIERGDRFYVFTDGATDQLSDINGKRLGTKNLVKEIVQLQSLPLSKQKSELESLFESWQGSETQTDDILLVGFEV